MRQLVFVLVCLPLHASPRDGSGVSQFVAAPAGIPANVNQRLTAALTTIMASEDLRARLIDNGFDPEFQTGKDAREFVAREIRKWRQAVKDSGAKPN